jgi:uncharacterized protein YjiS (DUF1127 family)
LSMWKRWSNERITFNELSRLTDRDLRDIGIARCDINSIAKETAFQNLSEPVRELSVILTRNPIVQS